MLQVLKMKIPYIITFVIFYFIFEALTFAFVNMSGIARFFVLDLFITLFFTSFTMLFKSNKVTIILLSIFMFFITILFCVNAHIYKIFGDIFSINYLKVLNEAEEVFDWNFISFWIIALGLFVYLIYVGVNITIYFFTKKITYTKDTEYIVSSLFLTILTTVVVGIFIAITKTIADNNTYVNGKKVKDNTFVTTLAKKAFKHYGILGMYYKEIEIKTRKKSSNGDDNNNYTSESDYDGLLKGKNVITIMGETLQDFCISETLTPNLYKLSKEGIHFSNNYSVNKTDMSEMIGITGSYYSFYDANYDVDFAIPNILEGKYKTTYVHDNSGVFYGRSNLVKYFGFEHSYFHDDLYAPDFKNEIYPNGLPGWEDNDWHWGGDYTLDSVTIDLALPYLVSKDKPFYSFWTSLIMHGPYTGGSYSNKQLYKNLGYYAKVDNAIKEGKWVNPLKGMMNYENYLEYYECAAIDFDIAIGKIIDYLEKEDLLDDTLLVIYGDHEAYYHDIYLRMANTQDKTQVDKLYQTTLIMYNPKLNNRFFNDFNSHEYIDFSSPFVVAPTVLDLLGISFDRNWYANYSAFDRRYLKVFYSYQQKAFMNNNFYSEDLESLAYVRDASIDSSSFINDAVEFMGRLAYCEELYESSLVD